MVTQMRRALLNWRGERSSRRSASSFRECLQLYPRRSWRAAADHTSLAKNLVFFSPHFFFLEIWNPANESREVNAGSSCSVCAHSICCAQTGTRCYYSSCGLLLGRRLLYTLSLIACQLLGHAKDATTTFLLQGSDSLQCLNLSLRLFWRGVAFFFICWEILLHCDILTVKKVNSTVVTCPHQHTVWHVFGSSTGVYKKHSFAWFMLYQT